MKPQEEREADEENPNISMTNCVMIDEPFGRKPLQYLVTENIGHRASIIPQHAYRLYSCAHRCSSSSAWNPSLEPCTSGSPARGKGPRVVWRFCGRWRYASKVPISLTKCWKIAIVQLPVRDTVLIADGGIFGACKFLSEGIDALHGCFRFPERVDWLRHGL